MRTHKKCIAPLPFGRGARGSGGVGDGGPSALNKTLRFSRYNSRNNLMRSSSMSSESDRETEPLLKAEGLSARDKRVKSAQILAALLSLFHNPTVLSEQKKREWSDKLSEIEKYFSVDEIKDLLIRFELESDPKTNKVVSKIPGFFLLLQLPHITEKVNGKYTYENILNTLAEDAYRYFKKFPGTAKKLISPEVLFFAVDKLFASIKWYNWIKLRTFCSDKNPLTNCAIDKIAEILASNNPADKTVTLTRLEKFPPKLIARVLNEKSSYIQLSAKDVKSFPKIQLEWSICQTADYQKILNSKNVSKFIQAISHLEDTETLENLIRHLVHKINTSWFKGRYEDMMEACLKRLMHLSDPQKKPELDPELLKQCLRIINNYKPRRNRVKFFLYENEKKLLGVNYHYLMLAYVRRLVPRFDDFPKLQELIKTDNVLGKEFEIYSESNQGYDRFKSRIMMGSASPQDLLLEIARVPDEFSKKYKNFAEVLVDQHGADLDFSDGVRLSFFDAALIELGKDDSKDEMWKFYLSKNKDDEVFSKVIDMIIALVPKPHIYELGPDYKLAGCGTAISRLITRQPNPIKVTQEIIDKLKVAGIGFPDLEEAFARQQSVTNNNNTHNAATSTRSDMEQVKPFDPFASVEKDPQVDAVVSPTVSFPPPQPQDNGINNNNNINSSVEAKNSDDAMEQAKPFDPFALVEKESDETPTATTTSAVAPATRAEQTTDAVEKTKKPSGKVFIFDFHETLTLSHGHSSYFKHALETVSVGSAEEKELYRKNMKPGAGELIRRLLKAGHTVAITTTTYYYNPDIIKLHLDACGLEKSLVEKIIIELKTETVFNRYRSLNTTDQIGLVLLEAQARFHTTFPDETYPIPEIYYYDNDEKTIREVMGSKYYSATIVHVPICKYRTHPNLDEAYLQNDPSCEFIINLLQELQSSEQSVAVQVIAERDEQARRGSGNSPRTSRVPAPVAVSDKPTIRK